jgi:hypothetical protein
MCLKTSTRTSSVELGSQLWCFLQDLLQLLQAVESQAAA